MADEMKCYVFAVLAVTIVAFGSVLLARARPALACTPADFTLDEATNQAEVIVAGAVVDERSLGREDEYSSTLRVVATLKGTSGENITLAPIGFLSGSCGGGPRLAKGERVLLFLVRQSGSARNISDLQVLGYTSGRYVLENGQARRDPYGAQQPAEEMIRRTSAITGAPRSEVDAAIALAEGEPLPENKDSWVPIIAGAGAALGLALLLAGISRRRMR